MEYIQQKIDAHKNKIQELITKLINTQLVNQEIMINNELKIEIEFLNSLLNVKKNSLMTKNKCYKKDYNNIHPSQPNLQPKETHININSAKSQIIQKNITKSENYSSNNNKVVNIQFDDTDGNTTILLCNHNDKLSEVIRKYKDKTKDYKNNWFLFNNRKLNNYLASSLNEIRIDDGNKITVLQPKTVSNSK